jgi:signal transduction histidine kinase
MLPLLHQINRLFGLQLRIERGTEIKRVILMAYMCLLALLVAVVYSVVDLINGVYYGLIGYSLVAANSFWVIRLIKRGQILFAKIVLVVTFNSVVYYAYMSDPPGTGVYMLFIPVGMVSVILFDFSQKIVTWSVIVFTGSLFLFSYFSGFHLAYEPPTELYVQLSFVINYSISVTLVVLAFNFFLLVNRAAEAELIRQECILTEKNQQLTKVNEELDRFVYSVSHDLRSPLSSIQGIINLIRITPDPEEVRHLVGLIEGRVRAQEQFIYDIINYSRNARTEVHPEPVLLQQFVQTLVDDTAFLPEAKGMTITVEIDPALVLHIDKTRLQIVLQNLLGNSIKYSDPKKSARWVRIKAVAEAGSVLLSVEDNGIGIAPELLPRVFDMFYRASERSKGSGLGLFITREAIQKIGGTVAVESEPGIGTRFYLTLARTALGV